jgi:predicted transcriptional regulator
LAPEQVEAAEEVEKPSIPLKDIVKDKYAACLECGKKMRPLTAHIRKAHGLKAKDYFKRFGLDPKISCGVQRIFFGAEQDGER